MPALAVAIASAAIAAYLAVGAARTGIGLAAVTAIAITTAWASRKALGGRTGDTLGATIALAGLVSVVAIGAAWS
jgi:cobalamin synthase